MVLHIHFLLLLFGIFFLGSWFYFQGLWSWPIGRKRLPRAVQIEFAEFLSQLHGLCHHPFDFIIIPHLQQHKGHRPLIFTLLLQLVCCAQRPSNDPDHPLCTQLYLLPMEKPQALRPLPQLQFPLLNQSSPDATEISGVSKKTLLFALLPCLSSVMTKQAPRIRSTHPNSPHEVQEHI